MQSSEAEDVNLTIKKFMALKMNESREEVIAFIKILNLFCTKGPTYQNTIASESKIIDELSNMITSDDDLELKLKSFQLLANLCVQNKHVQNIIWNKASNLIIEQLKSNQPKLINTAAMIIHNMILNGKDNIDISLILTISLEKAFELDPIPDFLHILLDHLMCSNKNIVKEYNALESEYKKKFLLYAYNHAQNDDAEILKTSLVQHISLEFKKKSDCILKTVSSYVDSIDPEIVFILLDIIAAISSREKYYEILKNDRSLFLNLGCLLQAIHKMGKNSNNIFTPIQKLDALLPTSEDKADIESKISYSFKTQLVRSLANLCHRNEKNQELAREMEIMQSIFDCTNVDARNPLIKEWSILAIRNLCENNAENQEIVRQLTRVGDSPNPVLNEFGIENGVFRIKKS